ncbi:hypothetical protein ACLB1T_15855 [Escherichia coli]
MLEAHSDSSIVPLSKSTPDVETPSLKPLWRELSRVVQHNLQTVLGYDLLAGSASVARANCPPDARQRLGGHRR